MEFALYKLIIIIKLSRLAFVKVTTLSYGRKRDGGPRVVSVYSVRYVRSATLFGFLKSISCLTRWLVLVSLLCSLGIRATRVQA